MMLDIAKNYLTTNFFSLNMSHNDASNKHMPWPQSPNLTTNKKGNVAMVNTLGFASWYLATLQQQQNT